MKTVAKLVMVDDDDKYLMMYRNGHPVFGDDPDLPGGTLEDGESAFETMLREVDEEAGVKIEESTARELYSGTEYSKHQTLNVLYIAKLTKRPEIVMSWEHSSYEWLPLDAFIEKANGAVDTYMHMVGGVMKKRL